MYTYGVLDDKQITLDNRMKIFMYAVALVVCLAVWMLGFLLNELFINFQGPRALMMYGFFVGTCVYFACLYCLSYVINTKQSK
jgi:hypothetical protein